MTNVLARCSVVCALLFLAACGGGGSNSVNTGVCSAGEFRCSGDVLETCSVDRTGFTTVATCQAGLCDAVGKQCDNCKAGEGTCTGAAAGKLCSSDGQKLEDVTCSGSTPFCVASGKAAACVACRTSVDCSVSTNPCQLSVCSAEGSCGSVAVAADTACSASGGKCDGAGNCRECAAGEKRCSGVQPQSCGADGKWVTGLACASPAPLCLGGDCVQCAAASDCPASGNDCTQAVCSNGTCGYAAKPQGTACAGGTCNAAGVCNACTPGTKVCNGNQVLSCNGSGQYDPPSSCSGNTPYCENSTGSCVQCTSVAQCPAPTNPCLQAACSGNVCGVTARTDGTVCAVGNEAGTCQAGACTLCTAGQTRCQPGTNIPQSCSGGLWVGTAACASPTALCNAGACVECITAANCPASSNACLQSVCTSGVCGYTAKAQGTACTGGTCNGAGQCNACTPNTSVCNGNQILTCGSNGQYAAPTTCSAPTAYCDSATTTCVQCTSAAHCSAPTNPCLQATCAGGSCGVSVRADGTACSIGTDSGTCSAGSCAVCTNGAIRCKPGVTTTPQVCSNGQWADQAVCASGQACYQGACSACASGLTGRVGWWSAETSTLDRLGVHNGTARSGLAYGAGRVGQAFKTTMGDVRIPDAPALRFSTAMSVEAWIYLESAPTSDIGAIAAKNRGSGGTGFHVSVSNDRRLTLGVCTASGGCTGIDSVPTFIAVGQWTHVAATWTAGGTFKLYVNGVLAGSGSLQAFGQSTLPLVIGSEDTVSGRRFPGFVDELGIYNVELSAADVAKIHTAGTAGKCP